MGFLWAAVFSYSHVADTGEIKACKGKCQLQFYSSSTKIKKYIMVKKSQKIEKK